MKSKYQTLQDKLKSIECEYCTGDGSFIITINRDHVLNCNWCCGTGILPVLNDKELLNIFVLSK